MQGRTARNTHLDNLLLACTGCQQHLVNVARDGALVTQWRINVAVIREVRVRQRVICVRGHLFVDEHTARVDLHAHVRQSILIQLLPPSGGGGGGGGGGEKQSARHTSEDA